MSLVDNSAGKRARVDDECALASGSRGLRPAAEQVDADMIQVEQSTDLLAQVSFFANSPIAKLVSSEHKELAKTQLNIIRKTTDKKLRAQTALDTLRQHQANGTVPKTLILSVSKAAPQPSDAVKDLIAKAEKFQLLAAIELRVTSISELEGSRDAVFSGYAAELQKRLPSFSDLPSTSNMFDTIKLVLDSCVQEFLIMAKRAEQQIADKFLATAAAELAKKQKAAETALADEQKPVCTLVAELVAKELAKLGVGKVRPSKPTKPAPKIKSKPVNSGKSPVRPAPKTSAAKQKNSKPKPKQPNPGKKFSGGKRTKN